MIISLCDKCCGFPCLRRDIALAFTLASPGELHWFGGMCWGGDPPRLFFFPLSSSSSLSSSSFKKKNKRKKKPPFRCCCGALDGIPSQLKIIIIIRRSFFSLFFFSLSFTHSVFSPLLLPLGLPDLFLNLGGYAPPVTLFSFPLSRVLGKLASALFHQEGKKRKKIKKKLKSKKKKKQEYQKKYWNWDCPHTQKLPKKKKCFSEIDPCWVDI